MQLKVYGPAVYLPVAIAGGISTAASSDLSRHSNRLPAFAALLRFGKRAPGGRRQRPGRQPGFALVGLIGLWHRKY